MANASRNPDSVVRPLRADDLERMIAIDQAYTGRARRRFFEKRLQTGLHRPQEFVNVGVEWGGALVGFAFARIMQGEFGRSEPVASLDAMGVEPASQEQGYGHALMDAILGAVRKHGVKRLHSQADWTNHGLLKFLDSSGFTLAPRIVLERSVVEPLTENTDEV